jgi:uncharacterized RDD family membrane protein YckC
MNYHLARDGQQLGIYSDTEVSSKVQSGELQGSDLCWTEGMADWQPVSTIWNSLPAAAMQAVPGALNPYAPPSVDVSRPIHVAARAQLASLGERLGAALLDGLVAVGAMVPFIIGVAMNDRDTDTIPPLGLALMAAGGVALLGLFVYNLVLLGQKGQTLGKKWLGICIVNYEDHGQAGFVKAFILRTFVNGLIAAFVPFYNLVDICFIFRDDRRCIHDLIASTTVIKVSQ